MAERTISISPLDNTVTLDNLQLEFAGLSIERMALLSEQGCAYVQFASPSEVEALANRYNDCRVPSLGGAEIGFVEQGFKWPTPKATARAESLVVVKNCDRLAETPEARIRQIFKQFAIDKVVKFEETGHVVLEFHNQDDLELIDMNFDNFRVPELGGQAEIEVDNAFPVDRFLQRYLERNQIRVLQPEKKEKKEVNLSPQKKEERGSKELDSRRKLQEMEREIMQKEKVRKSEVEAFERARREKEEKERIEKSAREKKERQQREKREQLEQLERQRLQALRQAQLEQQQRALAEEQERLRRLAQEQQQREEEQRLLVERIASIKQEVEQEENRIREKVERESGQWAKGGDGREPELEHILSQQKQIRKKEIKLPEIIKISNIETKGETATVQQPKQQTKPVRQFVIKDYSRISVHFITVVAVAWIYYILVR